MRNGPSTRSWRALMAGARRGVVQRAGPRAPRGLDKRQLRGRSAMRCAQAVVRGRPSSTPATAPTARRRIGARLLSPRGDLDRSPTTTRFGRCIGLCRWGEFRQGFTWSGPSGEHLGSKVAPADVLSLEVDPPQQRQVRAEKLTTVQILRLGHPTAESLVRVLIGPKRCL